MAKKVTKKKVTKKPAKKIEVEKINEHHADLLTGLEGHDKKHKERESQLDENIEKEKSFTEEHVNITKHFYVAVAILLIILGGIFLIPKFFDKDPVTLDILHQENLERGYDTELSYVFNGYSFIYLDGLWYTQIQDKSRDVMFDVPLHYGPKDVIDIPFSGDFEPFFLKAVNNTISNYTFQTYLTFNPESDQLQYVGLATGELTQNMVIVYNLAFIPACTSNETDVCASVPTITCDSTDDPVVFIAENETTEVRVEDNCIIIQGDGEDIVKAVDRFLLAIHGILI